ncbi:hypothetical protein Acr_00g0055270 [Actinidia rufa]|uniref:Uncharacterized protein n=1 Tax=Actinidia rufa TaxID=165716 RepID=A0A7J0DM37_9ERIC|nr:hypothetical protein Acr_00g0055270 [Actinidia rufa]
MQSLCSPAYLSAASELYSTVLRSPGLSHNHCVVHQLHSPVYTLVAQFNDPTKGVTPVVLIPVAITEVKLQSHLGLAPSSSSSSSSSPMAAIDGGSPTALHGPASELIVEEDSAPPHMLPILESPTLSPNGSLPSSVTTNPSQDYPHCSHVPAPLLSSSPDSVPLQIIPALFVASLKAGASLSQFM